MFSALVVSWSWRSFLVGWVIGTCLGVCFFYLRERRKIRREEKKRRQRDRQRQKLVSTAENNGRRYTNFLRGFLPTTRFRVEDWAGIGGSLPYQVHVYDIAIEENSFLWIFVDRAFSGDQQCQVTVRMKHEDHPTCLSNDLIIWEGQTGEDAFRDSTKVIVTKLRERYPDISFPPD